MVSPDVAKYGLAPWPLIIIPIPFLVVALIALLMRMWVRIFMTRSFGYDDGFLIAAYVGFLAEGVSLVIVGDIQLNQGIVGPAFLLGKINFAGIAGYIFSQICFKLSLAVFFLRILIERWQRWTILVTITIFIAYTLALLFVTIFSCGDPNSPTLMDATCLDWDTILGPVNYVGAAMNAIVDWIFALTPILVIRKTQMTRRSKTSVICLILLAVSGSIISILRIPYINGLDPASNYYSKSSDRIAYASIAEGGVGITAASLATLKPMFLTWLQRTRSNSGQHLDKRPKEDHPTTPWAQFPGPQRKFGLLIEDIEMQSKTLSDISSSSSHQRPSFQDNDPRFLGRGNSDQSSPSGHILVSTSVHVSETSLPLKT